MTSLAVVICSALLVMTPDGASATLASLDYISLSNWTGDYPFYIDGSKFSDNSKFLAIAARGFNRVPHMWLYNFNEHGLPVLATTKYLGGLWPVAFSANSKVLAVGQSMDIMQQSIPNAVQMYSLDSDSGPSVEFTLDSFCDKWSNCSLNGMEFSADSKLLAIVASHPTKNDDFKSFAWIYNIADGGKTSLECTFQVGHHAVQEWDSQVGPAFSGDSKFLAINSAGTNHINVYSIVNGSCPTLKYSLPPVASMPTGLAFSSDSHYIATSFGSSVRIYDMHSPQQFNLNDANTDITGIAFSPDSTQLATKSKDGGGHLWVYSFEGGSQPKLKHSIDSCINVTSGHPCKRMDFTQHDRPSFSADSRMVASSYFTEKESHLESTEVRLYFPGWNAAQASFDSDASLLVV